LPRLKTSHEGLRFAHPAGELSLPDPSPLAGSDQDFNQPLMTLCSNRFHSCDLCEDGIYANFGKLIH
jgi:hypothetical protein